MKIAEKRLAGRAVPRGASRQALIAAALAALAGCASPEPVHFVPVQLTGETRVPDGTSGSHTVHVVVYQAWRGTGASREAVLEPIESFQTEAGAFRRQFEYPDSSGEGLVVWAWLDTDGDGQLCSVPSDSEPAGLAVVEPFPTGSAEITRMPGGMMVEQRFAERVKVELDLAHPCRAAESLFPETYAHRQD